MEAERRSVRYHFICMYCTMLMYIVLRGSANNASLWSNTHTLTYIFSCCSQMGSCYQNHDHESSRSASDNIWIIIEKKKRKVYTYINSIVQLAVPCLPVTFQSLLPTNEKLHAPTLPAVIHSTIDIQRIKLQKLQTLTASCRPGSLCFTDGSIVPHARGVRFSLAQFLSPPLSCMKQVLFEST